MLAGKAAGCMAVIAVNHMEDEELTKLADVSTNSVSDFIAS
jgi:hypothetical protein